MASISVVINVLNEEKNIERVLNSVEWADEIVVVDDGSADNTLEVLSKLKVQSLKLKVYKHKGVGYVEPARNFAISKASGDWILILDADEEIPIELASKLREIVEGTKQIDFVEIPRKNIIFNKWIQNSFWWPDYNIRFFKKGSVTWKNQIHSKPETKGAGLKLEPEEQYALVHHNYDNLSQYLFRLDRYSTVQAKELVSDQYKFKWTDLITQPLSEFLSRYFANGGYKDGLHGLALSLLQSFSFLIVYLKVWEKSKFEEEEINLSEMGEITKKAEGEIDYWLKQSKLSANPFKRFLQKARNKLT